MTPTVDTIRDVLNAVDACLPQMQCARCGYAACRPYAVAIVEGNADINRCPPGGRSAIAALAAVLKTEVKPLDPACGVERELRVAVVDEQWCIGCTICIQVCPVDAILGAAKQMHAVIEADCTGCELCVAPCPVDCIRLVPAPRLQQGRQVDGAAAPLSTRGATVVQRWGDTWTRGQAERARRNYSRRRKRLERRSRQRAQDNRVGGQLEQKRAAIARAVERVHRRRSPRVAKIE